MTKTHTKDTPAKNLRLNIKFKNTETDNEEQDDLNAVFELEEATETVDEVQNPVASTNLDEASHDKLLNLPSPKVSTSRAGVKSACMEQMMLLMKIDPKRLKDEPVNKSDFCTHECKHYKKLMKFPSKEKKRIKIET